MNPAAMWRSLRDGLFGWDAFISYAREDEPWAHAVEKLLGLGRFRVYRDRTELALGGHLDMLLDAVRRSTMLVVLVSEHAVASDWVHQELQAHLARPRRRHRLVPVFLDPRYPASLPERFRALASYAGLTLPQPARQVAWADAVAAQADRRRLLDVDARTLLSGVKRNFQATRKSVRQLAAAAAITTVGLGGSAFQVEQMRAHEARDALLKEAALQMRDERFDLAEHALAEAWRLDPRPSIRDQYREARGYRAIERPTPITLARDQTVLAVDQAEGQPYLLVREGEDLHLRWKGQDRLLASACGAAPGLATRGAQLAWACGPMLGLATPGTGADRHVMLPAVPATLRLVDGRIELLFQEGGVIQLGVFAVPSLQPLRLARLPAGAGTGEVGFCPEPGQLAWHVFSRDGRAIFERWEDADQEPRRELQPFPTSADGLPRLSAWISRAWVARDCERFVLEYAPFTVQQHASYEATRFRLRAARPVDRFEDEELRDVVLAPDASGLEAVYLTTTRELRAFVLEPVPVLGVTVRSLASGVERIARWPSAARDELWFVALSRSNVTIYRDRKPWSRYPLAVGEPIRVVSSPDGEWLLVEGGDGGILWRRARPWSGGDPPEPATVEAETKIEVPRPSAATER